MDNFQTLVQWFGVPGAMLFVMVMALNRGVYVTRREHDALKAEKEAQKQDYEHRLDVVRLDRDFWRDTAIGNMQIAEKATCTVEHAMTKLPSTQPPPLPRGE